MNGHNYLDILTELKAKIQQARRRALLAANNEMLFTYWEIGNTIIRQKKLNGWGAKVINKLIADLKTEFPNMKGLSPRNFRYMQTFASAYPNFGTPIHPASDNKSIDNQKIIIRQQAAAQLPWSHHQIILDKVSTLQVREFYIHQAAENGWNRNTLLQQIRLGLFERQGGAITNFSQTLPKDQSDLAQEIFKSPYIFDFIQATENQRETELEKSLIQHMKNFILELGRGFAYVGNQHRVRVGDEDIYLDILFFHYLLNCFVIFEFKITPLKPEYAGKLNFYTTVVDEEIKCDHHKPTIGVLLCKSSNQTMVKFSLKNITSPLGVSTFELMKDLPAELKTVMPSVEELEQEMEKEIKLHTQAATGSQLFDNGKDAS
jgi:predicted nuclease of restriction endonuclease-like (RecB) superfamily